jgi:microcystin-dependent protein
MKHGKRTPGAPAGDKPVVATGDMVIGTVVPYAGLVNAEQLAQQGWLYCDGRAMSRTTYADLFRVIGTLHGGGDGVKTFNLPDYRGWFLRGVDDGAGRDPDAATRTAAAAGGQVGDECGTAQYHATAQPKEKFIFGDAGQHAHDVNNVPNSYSSLAVYGFTQAIWNSGKAPTDPAGTHQHKVVGGDPESRPVNAYVGYVIKYRA